MNIVKEIKAEIIQKISWKELMKQYKDDPVSFSDDSVAVIDENFAYPPIPLSMFKMVAKIRAWVDSDYCYLINMDSLEEKVYIT